MTVRDFLKEVQKECRDTDLQPNRAAELLVKLTAIFGNCTAEIRAAEMDYNGLLMKLLDSEEKANRAKIRAQTSPEYLRLREAKDAKDLVLELSRSLKYLIKVAEAEMQLAR